MMAYGVCPEVTLSVAAAEFAAALASSIQRASAHSDDYVGRCIASEIQHAGLGSLGTVADICRAVCAAYWCNSGGGDHMLAVEAACRRSLAIEYGRDPDSLPVADKYIPRGGI